MHMFVFPCVPSSGCVCTSVPPPSPLPFRKAHLARYLPSHPITSADSAGTRSIYPLHTQCSVIYIQKVTLKLYTCSFLCMCGIIFFLSLTVWVQCQLLPGALPQYCRYPGPTSNSWAQLVYVELQRYESPHIVGDG